MTTTAPRVGDTLTTAEQLDALPYKAVVLDEHAESWQKLGEGLWCGNAGSPMSGSALLRTRTDEVTVLHVPGEQPRPSVTDNARAETTTGAIARGEALAAGDPDWMNVTRWPRTEAEATTTILRLIEELRRTRSGARTLGRIIEQQNRDALDASGMHHVVDETGDGDWEVVWEALALLRPERDELAAKVAAVEALADETEQAGDPLLRLDRLRAALSTAPTDTSGAATALAHRTDKENNR